MKIDGIEFTPIKTNLIPDKVESDTDNVKSINYLIEKFIDKMESPQRNFNTKVINFLQGKESLPSVIIAGEKAKISLTYAVKIRDKIIEAYKEIMRMQM